jgi:hypothetical protein
MTTANTLLCAFAAFSCTLQQVHAVNQFESFHLSKFKSLIQDSESSPDPAFTQHGLSVLAFYTPEDAMAEASFTPPDSPATVLDLGLIPGSLEYIEDFYGSAAERDEVFPDGDYLVDLIPEQGATQAATVSMTTVDYPDPLVLSDYASLQGISVGGEIVLNWSPSNLAGIHDCIQVAIMDWTAGTYVYRSPEPGLPGALAAGTTSVVIPDGILLPFESYTLELHAHRVTSVDTSQIPGATLTVSRTTLTMVDFDTDDVDVPDTQSPLVLAVDPPVGSTDVSPSSPVTFTFSEPMSSDVAILWEPATGGGEYSWDSSQTILTYTHTVPFPSGQAIRWTLNPEPGAPGLADVAGNLILPGKVTGSFSTTRESFGDAPAEWLPGPTSVADFDSLPSTATMVFAADTLKGFQIQKSKDLEDWETIATVVDEHTLAEIGVTPPSNGASEFYRAAHFGGPLDILADESATVGKPIHRDGGVLTATGQDGTVYTLTIPPNAVLSPTYITMTPLDEVLPFPLSQGLVAGVLLEPAGLQLMDQAELRMQAPSPVDPAEFIAFNAKSTGIDFAWRPWTIENGNEIVLQLSHFSIHGGGRGTPGEMEGQPDPCDPLAKIRHQGGILLNASARAQKQGDEEASQILLDTLAELIENFYNEKIIPAFKKAKSNRDLLPCTMRDYLDTLGQYELLTGESQDLPWPPDLVPAYQNAWNVSLKNCQEGDFREIVNLIDLAAQDQLLGIGAISGDYMSDILECLSFKLDFSSDIHYGGFINRGHHRLEAKDIELEMESLVSGVRGSGPLVYLEIQLDHNYPDCPPAIKEIKTTNGTFEIDIGAISLKEGRSKGCDCQNQSMDPEGKNGLEFTFWVRFGSPTESWTESMYEIDQGCIDFTQNATDWKDVFAGAHKDLILEGEGFSGPYYEPLVILVSDFDSINKDFNGRRKVAEKQVFRKLPGETLFYDFDDITSETIVTIWHDPPAPAGL